MCPLEKLCVLFKLLLDLRFWKLFKKILLMPPILNCEDLDVQIYCFTGSISNCFTAALTFLLLAFLHLFAFFLLRTLFAAEIFCMDEAHLKFDLICHVLICYSHFKSCSRLIELFVFLMEKDFT